MRLTRFTVQRPTYETDQASFIAWIAAAHAESEAGQKGLDGAARDAFRDRTLRLLGHLGLGPDKIRARGHMAADVGVTDWAKASLYDIRRLPHGEDFEARARFYAEAVDAYFAASYAAVDTPPSEIVHVTCTGYVSPSGAQKLVAGRGWGAGTRITHAYHMGCYAAFPAVRMAMGSLCLPRPLASATPPSVDVVHTELCSLHFDPHNHAPEQLLVQSLFADGLIRYSISKESSAPGLDVLAVDEQVLPDSSDAMTWVLSPWGMKMTLARDVPERIAGQVAGFVDGLFARARLRRDDTVRFAVHPGGPKIIERVAQVLGLESEQIQTSRDVLRDHGNMSSATLPHVWARLVDDEAVAAGTPVVSLAFGPGLTVAGGLFRKA